MAFLDEEQLKQLGSNQGFAGQGGSPFAGASQPQGGGGGGKGGKGLFTNIQSYLGANQEPSRGTEYLQSGADEVFGQAEQGFQNQANQYQQGINVGGGLARGLINQGRNALSQLPQTFLGDGSIEASVLDPFNRDWGATPGNAYQSLVDQISDAGRASYTAPAPFEFQADQAATDFNTKVGGDQKQFSGLMNELYGKQLQGWSPGQNLLQQQLDAVTPEFGQMREGLGNRYQQYVSGGEAEEGRLNTLAADTQREVTEGREALQRDYTSAEDNLDNYLRDLDKTPLPIEGGLQKTDLMSQMNALRQKYGLPQMTDFPFYDYLFDPQASVPYNPGSGVGYN